MWALPAVPTRALQEGQAHRARLESTVVPLAGISPQLRQKRSVQGRGRAEGLHLQSLPMKPVIHRQLGRVLRTTQGAPPPTLTPPLHSGPSHWPAEVCLRGTLPGSSWPKGRHPPRASGEKALEGDSCSPLCCPWSPVEAQSWVGPPSPATRVTGQTQGHAARASPSPCSRLRPALWAALGCNK